MKSWLLKIKYIIKKKLELKGRLKIEFKYPHKKGLCPFGRYRARIKWSE